MQLAQFRRIAVVPSPAMDRVTDVRRAAALNYALDALRRYLVDSTERKGWDDQGTAELSEVICSCVESIGVSHRGHELHRRLPLDEFRHAIRYVDEHLSGY